MKHSMVRLQVISLSVSHYSVYAKRNFVLWKVIFPKANSIHSLGKSSLRKLFPETGRAKLIGEKGKLQAITRKRQIMLKILTQMY